MATTIYIVLGVAAYLLAGYVTHILDRIYSSINESSTEPFGWTLIFWPAFLIYLGYLIFVDKIRTIRSNRKPSGRVPLAQKISDTIVARIEK